MFKTKKSIYIVLIAGIFISATTVTSTLISNKNDDNYFEITKNIRIMTSVYDNINTFYVDEPEPGNLMKKGIDAMLRSLDPYTVYIPESDIEDYRFMTTGQYGGIGAMIKTQDSYIVISEPYEDSPTDKAGIIAGDILLEIDGKPVVGKTIKEMSSILKGGAGTILKVRYKRDDVTSETTITREVIKIPSVPYYGMIDNEIGYVKLNSFTSTASSDVGKALKYLKDSSGMKKLVFDLRGNGGGLLHESVNIVNFFIAKGKTVVATKGRLTDLNRDYKTVNTPFDEEMPIVVLVDGYSASASEIVSGSLQDLDRAVIIGTTTYGKGLVQQTKDLNFGSKVKLTIAKYYTPSGRCIQKLDYANRNDKGSVSEVADSLIKAFTTKNGREVKDGRGVEPEIKIESTVYSKLTSVLIFKNYIFNYATDYKRDHAEIDAASTFSLSKTDYDNFITYLGDKEIEYIMDSEEMLKELREVAKEEKYYESSEVEFNALFAKLRPSLNEDMVRYKDEIIELLENEIVSRYYYQNGRAEASLKNDPYIKEAKDVLQNQVRYKDILTGGSK
ncbi:S41 family peptidase [Flavobacteriales bacterium]|jgi:carboxyl-terminal processing protease|nr:S41 family peptidase [Flavobacteriales bacterium]